MRLGFIAYRYKNALCASNSRWYLNAHLFAIWEPKTLWIYDGSTGGFKNGWRFGSRNYGSISGDHINLVANYGSNNIVLTGQEVSGYKYIHVMFNQVTSHGGTVMYLLGDGATATYAIAADGNLSTTVPGYSYMALSVEPLPISFRQIEFGHYSPTNRYTNIYKIWCDDNR